MSVTNFNNFVIISNIAEFSQLKKTAHRLNLKDTFWILSIYLQLKDVYKWVTLYKVGNKYRCKFKMWNISYKSVKKLHNT